MAEKKQIFESKVKYVGIFNFQGLYDFCYQWFLEEENYDVMEDKYTEKIVGADTKNVEIEWTATKKITDYFKYEIKSKFKITRMTNVEVTDASGAKVKTNNGTVEVKIKGTLIRDYDSKFEKTATRKFMRGIYEKWVITANINERENDLFKKCNDFAEQMKGYLALEGKK